MYTLVKIELFILVILPVKKYEAIMANWKVYRTADGMKVALHIHNY